MQARKDEQLLQANIGITREVGGKQPVESYVIQMIDDASGRLIAEARMNGSTFAKIITGHIMTVPVTVADSTNRQRYGLVESTIQVSGFRVSTANSILAQSWLEDAKLALAERGHPADEVMAYEGGTRGLVVEFRWFGKTAMPEDIRAALKAALPAIPSAISSKQR